jgi:uncharacterized protein HemY
MITLVDFFGDYMILTLKNGYIRIQIMKKIKEFKYIISIQIVVVAYNVTHLLEWSIILFLL